MTKLGMGRRLSRRLMSRWLLIAGCWLGACANAYAGAAASAAAGAETTADTGGPVQTETDAGGYAEVWGPPAGTRLPLLAAQDQDGQPRHLEDLAGGQGLLLFLYRSADW